MFGANNNFSMEANASAKPLIAFVGPEWFLAISGQKGSPS